MKPKDNWAGENKRKKQRSGILSAKFQNAVKVKKEKSPNSIDLYLN